MTQETPEELRKKYNSQYPVGTAAPVDLGHTEQFLDELEETPSIGTDNGN